MEEFIQSTKHIRFLRRRLRSFVNAHLRERSVEADKLGLMKAFREKISSTVPFYRQFAKINTFSDLPFIDKNTLRADPSGLVSPLSHVRETWRKETSGTTGPPVPITYSPTFYFDLLLLAIRKIAIVAGKGRVGSRPVFVVAITDNQFCRDFIVPDPTDEVGFLLQIVINESEPPTLNRLFRLLQEFQPECITVKPSILEVLTRHITKTNLEVRFSPELIISSGAHLDECLRATSESLFRSSVVNAYGMTEFGLIASECAQRNGLHIDRSAIICEIVDGSGASIPPGDEGELTLSSIANEAMPLLRYRTGDLARFETEPCPCGLAGWRIKQLAGRRVRCFRFTSGELFSPTHFNDLFARFQLSEFQVSQVALEEVQVLVEFHGQPVAVDDQLSQIRSYVESTLPGSVQVSVGQTKFSADSKFERYRTVA